MVFHYFQNLTFENPVISKIVKLTLFGQTGVTLFFVLSGFLITRILIFAKEDDNYFKNFYIRRALRIFPLYYLFLIIYYFAIPLIFNQPFTPFLEQIYYYTYIQNFSYTFGWGGSGPLHFWSLAVEEHFYLFWPIIVYYTSNKSLSKIIVLITIGAIILRSIFVFYDLEVFYFTFTRFDSLAIGAYLAILEKNDQLSLKHLSKIKMGLFFTFITTLIFWVLFSGEGQNFMQIIKFTLLSLTYFFVIAYLLIIPKDRFINKILKTKFFAFTGKISYGLYVYHPLIFTILHTTQPKMNIFISFFLSFGLSYLCSILSFYLFESQFLKLKKYFNYNTKKE